MVQVEKKETQNIKTHTIFEIILYGLFLATSVYYITNENFTEVFEKFEPSQFIFKNTTKHITFIPHAVSTLASSSLFLPSIFISILTYLMMRLLLRNVLKFWRKSTERKEESSRVLTLDPTKDTFTSTNLKKNYLSSTYFNGSSFEVTILSFFYGGLVYLSQRIQVWCLAISFTQLYHFNTGKSFYPLIIFTIIIAIQAAYSELKKWKNDAFINSNIIRTNRGNLQRGEILAGDIIFIRNNDIAPCDLVLLASKKEKPSKRKRVMISMNEAQVTGETAPVRKFLPIETDEKLRKIEVNDLEFHKGTLYVEDRLNKVIQKDFNEKNILFGNSVLICEDDVEISGVATWLSNETKALRPPKSTEDLRQPSPFSEYTIKGFLLTVTLMISISLLNTIIALMKHSNDLKVSYFTVWINNLMYLNMMVPQAMEQVRMAVCTVFSFHFRKGINVNNSLVSDILGSVTRIVSDKTGTLTKNKMEPFLSMVFPNENDHQIIRENSMTKEQKESSIILQQALAMFATTGKQPEEMALQKYMSQFAKITECDIQEPYETEKGEIKFKLYNGEEHKMIIHVNFGLNFTYLIKGLLFEHQGDYYVAIQAGGEELWTEKYWQSKLPKNGCDSFLKKESKAKSDIWYREVKNLPHFSGSPRIWGHGIKIISSSEAQKIISEWKQANLEDNNTDKLNNITLRAIEKMDLVSQTLMIDAYREGVVDGINELVSSGKQMSICTGDSENASKMIAKQIQFPSNHVFLKESEVELMSQLDEISNKNIPSTLFVNQALMKLLESTEKDKGFEAPLFQKLLALFEEKQGEKYLHYPIFCRATPSLKPFCVKMMQYFQPKSLYDSLFSKRNYVLAIGDGSNDLNMFHQADVSLGIESGETKDIISKASFSLSHEWKSTVSLLLKEGPEKSSLISLMVKLVFLKHWMTAFTLLFDLIYVGYTLMPLDPIDPIMMLIFNAIIFTQITSHTSIDHPPEEVYQKKDTMTFKSFLRWVLAAGSTGFGIDWIVRWLFPNANSKEFGAMILVAKSISISVYLVLITNEWSRAHQEDSSLSKQLTISILSLSLSLLCLFSLIKYENITNYIFKGFIMVLTIIFIIISLIPILKLTRMSFTFDLSKNFIGSFDTIMPRFLHWSHTWNGRILPIYLFILLVKISSGVSLIILIVIMILTSIVTWIIFLFCISKIGFLRALFEGKIIAVASISFLLGYLMGKFQ